MIDWKARAKALFSKCTYLRADLEALYYNTKNGLLQAREDSNKLRLEVRQLRARLQAADELAADRLEMIDHIALNGYTDLDDMADYGHARSCGICFRIDTELAAYRASGGALCVENEK